MSTYKYIKIKGRWISEHRYVVEQHIGCILPRTYQVHHINGNRRDNRLENLVVLTMDEHYKEHHPLYIIGIDSKERQKITHQRYVDNNRERINARRREYSSKHRTEISRKNREEYAANRDLMRQRGKENYQRHKEQYKAKRKVYYATHRDEILLKDKLYRLRKKEKLKSNEMKKH